MRGIAALLLLAGIGLHGPRAFAGARLRWEIWRLEHDPDERYRLAECYYQAGDFEKALVSCEAMLRRHPGHAPAAALRMEVAFILGRGAIYPLQHRQLCRGPQAMVEIDSALARADRALCGLDLGEAGRELRKILEYAKWLPDGVERQARVDQTWSRLQRIHAMLEDR